MRIYPEYRIVTYNHQSKSGLVSIIMTTMDSQRFQQVEIS